MGTVIQFPMDRVRPRRPIRAVTYKGTRQVAPADMRCQWCGCEIKRGEMHWQLSTQNGELFRSCNDCCGRGM